MTFCDPKDGKVKTNDIKKGMIVLLRNGTYVTMEDNARGNARMVSTKLFYGKHESKEIGSVYAWDIVAVSIGDEDVQVEHTANQLKAKELNEAFFGR